MLDRVWTGEISRNEGIIKVYKILHDNVYIVGKQILICRVIAS